MAAARNPRQRRGEAPLDYFGLTKPLVHRLAARGPKLPIVMGVVCGPETDPSPLDAPGAKLAISLSDAVAACSAAFRPDESRDRYAALVAETAI